MTELPTDLKINERIYIAARALMQEGWYPGWVPLPESGNCEIEFRRSIDAGTTILKFKDGRWVGNGWSLEAGRSTGEPDDDCWRIKPCTR